MSVGKAAGNSARKVGESSTRHYDKSETLRIYEICMHIRFRLTFEMFRFNFQIQHFVSFYFKYAIKFYTKFRISQLNI